ncbi:MAG: hypothetical protein FWC41_00965 [Firmicutes bacterium]|nr:hypothetical protein [Bacillota bacterium]
MITILSNLVLTILSTVLKSALSAAFSAVFSFVGFIAAAHTLDNNTVQNIYDSAVARVRHYFPQHNLSS